MDEWNCVKLLLCIGPYALPNDDKVKLIRLRKPCIKPDFLSFQRWKGRERESESVCCDWNQAFEGKSTNSRQHAHYPSFRCWSETTVSIRKFPWTSLKIACRCCNKSLAIAPYNVRKADSNRSWQKQYKYRYTHLKIAWHHILNFPLPQKSIRVKQELV